MTKWLFTLIFVIILSSSSLAYWDEGFAQRTCFNITNTDDGSLPAGTSINMQFDTASQILAGRMRSDCTDLRLIYNDVTPQSYAIAPEEFGGSGCNSASTNIVFRLQHPYVSGTSSEYCLYYGNASQSVTYPASEDRKSVV